VNRKIDNNKKIVKGVIFSSISFFIIAMTQECFCVLPKPCVMGYMSFLFGWLGVLAADPASFVWIANPLLFASWVKIKKSTRMTFILSVLSLIIMVSFLFAGEIIVSESGSLQKIISIKLGYWLWVLSAFIMVIGNGVLYYIKRKDG
jgi:hypothetical protein